MVNRHGDEQAGKSDLVVVTGAGSGIGRATALAFAGRGLRVVAVDVDGFSAAETADAAKAAGAPEAVARTCDVADWDAVAALATTVADENGPVAVLVNNAGVGMTGRFTDVDVESWRWIRSVNLDGVVHGCLAFGPAMLARGAGHVVNVSSALAYTPTATEPAYVATKAAVLALSRCLRADWGPRGVGVSAVCPGVTDTPIARSTRFLGGRDDPAVHARVERIFRRGARPETVAAAIAAAVESNRAVVRTGLDSRLGWWLARLLPLPVADRLARLEVV